MGLIIVDASVETPIIWEDTGTEQIGIVDQTKIVPHILKNEASFKELFRGYGLSET
ncbi:hypothetical protein [Enterococcus durans]|uniref:hypothetical protein n=1 Tax=Enterococcus durans TaxID=53345 RepID=UPI00163C5322|nr:hypothetical protein [Enterococcus durans]